MNQKVCNQALSMYNASLKSTNKCWTIIKDDSLSTSFSLYTAALELLVVFRTEYMNRRYV